MEEEKELIKQTAQEVTLDDGFDGYEGGIEGDDESVSDRLILGTRVKFTNEINWVTTAGEELSPNEDFIARDIKRVEVKWPKDKKTRPYTRVVPAGEKFRSMKKLNEETPRSEWVEGPDGQLHGPWQIQHYLYLLDRLMKKYTWVTGTIGGNRAIAELVDQIQDARFVYGPNVYAVIHFSDTFMPTRFGGRQRPHLIVVRYTRMIG